MSAQLFNGRHSAGIEGDFVIFLIGARLNRLRSLFTFLRIGRQMDAMQRELAGQSPDGMPAHRELGRPHIRVGSILAFLRPVGSLLPQSGRGASAGLGGGSTARCAIMAISVSGTRPSRCGPGSTRRSTATCRASAWAWQANTGSWARPLQRRYAAARASRMSRRWRATDPLSALDQSGHHWTP